MSKFNYNFARKTLGEDGLPIYAPSVLKVVTHHHEEIVDPETGETISNDWDTWETKVSPNAEDCIKMDYPRIVDKIPEEPLNTGYHWVKRGWEEGEDALHVKYVQEANPSPSVSEYDSAMERHLLAERSARGYTTREPSSYWYSEVPRWAQDARDWAAHMDEVMGYALEVMNAYTETGVIMPLSEFIGNLPKITWTYSDSAESDEEGEENDENAGSGESEQNPEQEQEQEQEQETQPEIEE